MARDRGIKNKQVWLCVDNQNALKALAGGPTKCRKQLKECLKDVKIVPLADYEIRAKWTPSHQNIPDNERADTLPKNWAN